MINPHSSTDYYLTAFKYSPVFLRMRIRKAALGKVDLIGSGGSIYVKPSVVAQVRGFLSRTVAPGPGVLGVAV